MYVNILTLYVKVCLCDNIFSYFFLHMYVFMLTFASEIREKVSPRRIEAASNKQHYRAVMTSFWRVQRRRDASCNCNAAFERSKPLREMQRTRTECLTFKLYDYVQRKSLCRYL